jgi:S-phase kinase-associated protein 1
MQRVVRLVAGDGHTFSTSKNAIAFSKTIASLLEDVGDDEPVPLAVDGPTLARVLDFGNAYAGELVVARSAAADFAIAQRRALEATVHACDFFEGMDVACLFSLLTAANYLAMDPLLNAVCMRLAGMVNDKSIEEIREIFGVKGDLTEEEDAAVIRDNAWAFRH